MGRHGGVPSAPDDARGAWVGARAGAVGDDRTSGAQPGAKTRLAIATFFSSDALVTTIKELDAAKFGRDQVCIIGLEQAVESLVPIAADEPGGLLSDLLSMIAKAEQALMFTGDDFVLVACGPLWQQIGGLARGGEAGPLVAASWMEPATRSELTRSISAGALVLSVQSATSDQQRRSVRILLSHSSHRVQTHEFTAN